MSEIRQKKVLVFIFCQTQKFRPKNGTLRANLWVLVFWAIVSMTIKDVHANLWEILSSRLSFTNISKSSHHLTLSQMGDLF